MPKKNVRYCFDLILWYSFLRKIVKTDSQFETDSEAYNWDHNVIGYYHRAETERARISEWWNWRSQKWDFSVWGKCLKALGWDVGKQDREE